VPPSFPIRKRPIATFLALSAGLALGACSGGKSSAPSQKPAKVEVIGHESELLRLTLTPQAEARLGLQLVEVGSGSAHRSRDVHGEVMAAPSAGGLPIASTSDLGALAAAQARADGEVGRLQAEVEVARKALARAKALVREEAGSLRAQDEAESALGAASANLQAAHSQRALLGPKVSGLGDAAVVWVRAAVFVADLAELDRTAPANIRPLGEGAGGLAGRPVVGPPSANPAGGTVDLYYAVANAGGRLRVGERVAVALPVRGADSGLVVPASAVLRDIYGGEWVYARTGPHAYERRRIESASQRNGQVVLARGLKPGVSVVSAGAAELFGTEFGAK